MPPIIFVSLSHPNGQALSSNLKVPIIPPKDIPVDLHIKALIGQKNRYLNFVLFDFFFIFLCAMNGVSLYERGLNQPG